MRVCVVVDGWWLVVGVCVCVCGMGVRVCMRFVFKIPHLRPSGARLLPRFTLFPRGQPYGAAMNS